MTHEIILAAHIAVLGYWLGADLCINSEFRFLVHRSDLDFTARDAMMDHVMNIDQHVRYALVLQFTLGAMLAAMLGFVGGPVIWIAPILGALWIGLVEFAHRQRKSETGLRLARIDRLVRYGVAALFVILAVGLLGAAPLWLRLKLGLFALLIGCGVAIRLILVRHFEHWGSLREQPSSATEAAIRQTYRQSTSVLVVLWLSIVAIGTLSVLKPF